MATTFRIDNGETMMVMLARQPMFVFTNLVFIVTVIFGTTLTAANQTLEHAVLHAKAIAVQEDAEVISDRMMFAWSSGGAFIGAYIGIAQAMLMASGNHVPMPMATDERRASKIVMAFSVALLSGIVGTPAIMATGYITMRWEFIFLLGCLVSYGAWAILYIAHKVSKRFMDRADKEGVAGVIDEAKKATGS